MKLSKALYYTFLIVFTVNILVLIALPWILSLRSQSKTDFLGYVSSIVFYEFCGICAAYIIWNARGVLKNLSLQQAFVLSNYKYVFRASRGCFGIAFAACIRLIIHVIHDTPVLFEYNTLFVPLFIVAGLLCLVVANLFKTATELKQDNDLVI